MFPHPVRRRYVIGAGVRFWATEYCGELEFRAEGRTSMETYELFDNEVYHQQYLAAKTGAKALEHTTEA
jgi:hypothetical protein